MNQFIQCIGAFIGCLGFSFIFRIHKNIKYAFIASFGGAIGWIIYLFTNNYCSNIISTLWAMIIVSLFSEIMARKQKIPATIFNVIGCFPLVPGKGIYQTMLYLISSNQKMFIYSLLETIGTAFSIAVGILIVSTIFKIIKTIKERDFIL